MGIFTDAPSSNPGLNFDLYALELCKASVQAQPSSEGAFTVGIFGSWGSGKTTLMRRIKTKLDDPHFSKDLGLSKCKTIWFNSWKYDNREAIWSALIQSILLEIASDSSGLSPQMRDNAKNLVRTIGLHAYGISKELIWGLFKKQIKEYTDVDIESTDLSDISPQEDLKDEVTLALLSDHYRNINGFEEHFKAVVDAYVGIHGRIVIFVDDLDRCLPDNALVVLEALKLYLDKANCVFFIGLDKRIIEQAVRERFSNSKITGKEYIEKMIQLSFFIPPNSFSGVKDVFSSHDDIVGNLAGDHDLVWEMTLNSTGSNLRKVKQFFASWSVVRNISLDLGIQSSQLEKLAKILLIQMQFPELYDELPKYNYNFISNIKRLLEFDRANKADQVKGLLESDPEIEKFFRNDRLVAFLRGYSSEPYHPDISDPDELKELFVLLSQVGRQN
jgi:KAP family P-loop domain